MKGTMEFFDNVAQVQCGVGATAEARLMPLAPLIEYYEREMGELPGRLMIATSFLADVQLMPGWSFQTSELREAIEQAQALVVSVMIRILNMQEKDDCNGDKDGNLVTELQHFLDQLSTREPE